MLGFAHRYLRTARGSDPEELVRQYARAMLNAAAAHTFPVDLDLVERHFGLEPHRAVAGLSQRGLTTPNLLIVLNASDPITVRKFTLAHEFMEVFFIALQSGAADGWMSDGMFTEMMKNHRKERLCDVGAAELVMPMEVFIGAMPVPVTLPWAQDLARNGGLSLTATLWRLMETGRVDAILVFWHHDLKPTEARLSESRQMSLFGDEDDMKPTKKLRVQRVIVPPGFPAHIPFHKSIPFESIVGRAFLEQRYLSGRDRLDLKNICGEFLVEAEPFNVAGQKLVISLIHLSESLEQVSQR